MSGLVVPNPIFQPVNASGTPYPGGKVRTYLAGSSTLTPTWSDAALTVPTGSGTSGGQTLDSAGQMVMYLSAAVSYKITVTDANGVPAAGYPRDNVSLAQASAGPTIPSPSLPNQILRTVDGTNLTWSASPTLASLGILGALSVAGAQTGTTLALTGTLSAAATTLDSLHSLGATVIDGALSTGSTLTVASSTALQGVATVTGVLTAQANLRVTEIAFASLPGSPAVNEQAGVSDSNTATWGAVIAGGGANHVQARWNGTNWTVVGK